MSMLEEHRRTLRQKRVRIVEDLEVNQVLLATLRQHNILTGDMQERIEAKTTRREKAGELLGILERRGQNAFERFIEALCLSSQEELAGFLDIQLSAKYQHNSEHTIEIDPVIEEPIDKLVAQLEDVDFLVTMMDSVWSSHRRQIDDTGSYVFQEPFGRAVILVNKKDNSRSHGTDVDVQNLSSLFKKLHFETECFQDLMSAEISKVLKDEAKHASHEQCSGFVLCILNYGSNPHEIYGEDGIPVKIENILSLFDGEHCPNLRGKPKLYFIHTGEPGENLSDSVKYLGVIGAESDSIADEPSREADVQSKAVVHEKADVLLIMSTSDAWRDEKRGSWFIRCFTYVISQYSGRLHIEEMITKVNALVHYKKLRIPEKRTTLRKKFYFKP